MQRRSTLPLIIGTFILRANTGAGGIILGLFLARLSANAGHPITSIEVGLLSVVYYVTELSLAPLMGALSDRWGRRAFLLIGPCMGLAHVSLIPFTPVGTPLPFLLSIQVLAGLSSAMLVPAVLGYLADVTAGGQNVRMRLMSFYELATSGGVAVGVVLGGFAWDRFGRGAFFLLALFYVLVILCMLFAPHLRRASAHGDLRSLTTRYLRILRTPGLYIFIPAWICISALLGVWLSSQLTFILSRPSTDHNQLLMGLTSGHGGGGRLSLVLGGYVLFFGLCLLFWAFGLRRVPRLFLMLASVAGIYLACLALTGLNHGLGGGLTALIWIPVLLLGIFAESSFAPSALAYLADLTEGLVADRGLLMGLYSVFLGLGQLLGNGLAGLFARQAGFDGLIYLTAILGFIALLSLLFLFWYERRQARQAASTSAELPPKPAPENPPIPHTQTSR